MVGLVAVAAGIWWALPPAQADEPPSGRVDEVDEPVAVSTGTPFVVVPSPEVQDLPGSPFTDVSDLAGARVPHHADRNDQLLVPAAELEPLVGAGQGPEAVSDWFASRITGFLGEMSSLRYHVTGQAWGDVDGDGDPDLYLTDQVGPNTLLLNEGGRFRVSEHSGDVALPDAVSGGAVFVDVDNDGLVDLHVLNRAEDSLFLNRGEQGFVDVSADAGIGDPGMGHTSAWGDFDGDGLLDVYVVNYGCQPCTNSPPVARADRDQDRLFRNVGGGRFEDWTATLSDVEATRGLGYSGSWFDYDGDGDQDLYVVNDVRDDSADDEVASGVIQGDGSTPGNALLRNDGAGCGGWCWTDVSESSGTGLRVNGMGLAVGDFDGSGTLDLFMTNSGFEAGPAKLLLNRGDGTFDEAGADLGANLGEWSWGANPVDVNGDGRLDIFVAVGLSELALQASRADLPDDVQGADAAAIRATVASGGASVLGSSAPPPWATTPSASPRTDNDRVLIQGADGTFGEYVLGDTSTFAPATFGSATADFDRDGRIDLAVGDIDSGYRLLRGTGMLGDTGRMNIRLVGNGTSVNRDAVGATIEIVTSTRTQLRAVLAGGSLGAGNALEQTVGLGDDRDVRLVVHWPDGTSSDFDRVPADSAVVVTQGESEPRVSRLS